MMLYADLLAAAKHNPNAADFQGLRFAYARSTEYDPYTLDEDTLTSLGTALDEGNLQMAITAINCLLEACYLDIGAHMFAVLVYESTGDEARSMYHRKFAKGLLDSILQSGNGRSHQTAFVVIDVREEYTVLKVLGIQPTVQSLREHEGHQFDVFEFRHPETGETTEMYFNIDLAKDWLGRQTERGRC